MFGSDKPSSQACTPVASAMVFEIPNRVLAYPSDVYGIQASVSNGALRVKGNVEDYSGVILNFEGCADARAFSGLQFRVSGNVGQGRSLLTIVGTVNNTTKPSGRCHPQSQATTYEDCMSPYASVPLGPGVTNWHGRWSDFEHGAPVRTAEPDLITHIGWALDYFGSAYTVDFTIDELRFF